MKYAPKKFWGDFFDSRFYVASIVSKINTDSILDVGCGHGILLHGTSAKHKVGIDLSVNSLTIAKKIDQKLELIVADARYLPFRDNYFQVVMAISLISEIPDMNERKIACEEIKRCSKKTSTLIVMGPNRLSRHYKKIIPEDIRRKYTRHVEIVNNFSNNFELSVIGYNPFSKILIYPIKKVFYKLPDSLVENLGIEKIIFRLLSSKYFLQQGRSYVITGKRK